MNVQCSEKSRCAVTGADVRDPAHLAKSTESASPFKLRKILVPVCLSNYTREALDCAMALARQFKARIILLHVLPVHYMTGWELDIAENQAQIDMDLQQDVERRLAIIVQEAVPDKIPIKACVRFGSPCKEIVNAATELDADLIVLSTHGHPGRIHTLIGGISHNVARLASCSVLIMRVDDNKPDRGKANPFKTDQLQSKTK